MKTENKTIVYFHIGRGGRYYNAGYKSFCGEKKIEEILNHQSVSTFINPENIYDVRRKLERRNLTNILNLLENCANEDEYKQFEEKTGLYLGEMYYTDCSGNTLISVKDAETGIGSINWDGDYDTDICCYLRDCDREDLLIIYKSNDYDKESLIKEYFNDCTDVNINWDKFNGDYSNLIDEYFGDAFDIKDFYNEEEN